MAIDQRPLSKRFDLAYVKRRQWPWNWLRISSILVVIIVGVIAASLSLRGDHRIHSPGDVASAHSMFGQDCAMCHKPDPQRNGFWLPASDEACLTCHNAVAHTDPHGHMFAGTKRGSADRIGDVIMSSNCAVCHNEHKGVDADITQIADQVCTQCHGDLDVYESAGRTWLPEYPHNELHENISAPDATNPYLHIRDFENLHPQWRLLANNPVDTTPIRFEHHVHMNPNTPRMDQRVADFAEQRRARGDNLPPVSNGTLTCVACHEPDESGRYMKPMVFEQHCQPCHNLGSKNGETVPHGEGLGEFITRIAAAKALTPPKPKPAASRGPGAGPKRGPVKKAGPSRGPSRGPSKPVTNKPETITLEDVAAKVQREADTFQRMILPACARCHGVSDTPEDIVGPQIPDRWLTHGEFDHSAHRFVDCLECHRQAGADAKPERFITRDPDALQTKMKWTGRTREVMLPGIETCQRCHARSHRHLVETTHKNEFDPHIIGGVRFDCMTCHVYHGNPRAVTEHDAPANPMTIDALLPITTFDNIDEGM